MHTDIIAVLMIRAVFAVGPAEFPFHGINAGAPVWNGVLYFTPTRAAATAATGCQTVRINFRIDGHGSWDALLLMQYDAIVNAAAQHNLEVLGLLCYDAMPGGQAEWNDDPDGDGLNAYVSDFSQTAYFLIERYKETIKRWEIWNEPDVHSISDPASDPQNAGGTYVLPRVFAKMLAETYNQCNYYEGRSLLTDHEISLVLGAVIGHDGGGSNPYGFWYDYIADVYAQSVWDWMEANVGRRYPWDYFGFHFYLRQTTTFSASQLGWYLNTMSGLKGANQDSTPFAITEFGWNTNYVTESQQAQNLTNAFNYLAGRSDIAKAYWYQWKDEPAGAWGIVRGDDSHKPSYDSFAALQSPGPPVADFTADNLVGEAPLEVRFTPNCSGGPIAEWAWDFGDDALSSTASPIHTYTEAGVYTVSLTATGPGGSDTNTKPAYIEVTPPPAPIPGDFDEDGDVDLSDYGTFLACYGGPGVPILIPGCDAADFDSDTDVDLSDYGVFLSCYNGPNQPPASGCVP
jgi:PKD repeat protein